MNISISGAAYRTLLFEGDFLKHKKHLPSSITHLPHLFTHEKTLISYIKSTAAVYSVCVNVCIYLYIRNINCECYILHIAQYLEYSIYH